MAFIFKLEHPDGHPADPPTFVSSIPSWNVGDKVIVGAAPRYLITATEYDGEEDVTTWVVAPVQNGH
jgi:hypothetical protein